jgi:hypothetical protein
MDMRGRRQVGQVDLVKYVLNPIYGKVYMSTQCIRPPLLSLFGRRFRIPHRCQVKTQLRNLTMEPRQLHHKEGLFGDPIASARRHPSV